jgi:hypothetical protein
MSSADGRRLVRDELREEVAMDAGGRSPTVVVVVDGEQVVVGRLERLPVDLALVDALARLHLAVRALGWAMCLRDPGQELCALIDLVGLSDVLATSCEPPPPPA